ncbi:MAG: hypothetical protein H0W83_06620 [Planctomycetes bacterium]|nr:hypothetical protein [Planctomycetota bacterium]
MEKSLYTLFVSNADLHVILLSESGIRVKLISLDENRAHGVVLGDFRLLVILMQGFDDCAVEMAQEEILGTSVFRQRDAGFVMISLKRLITLLHETECIVIEQVQAVTEIENGSDHKWVLDLLPTWTWVFGTRLCPGQRAILIPFPEVESVTEPIVIVLALQHGLAISQDGFTDRSIAPMEADDECGKPRIHDSRSAIVGGQLTLAGNDAGAHQELERLKLRLLRRQLGEPLTTLLERLDLAGDLGVFDVGASDHR